MERDFLTLMVIILIIAFAAVLVYRNISLIKTFAIFQNKNAVIDSKTKQIKTDTQDAYKQIIERSKSDYDAFMEKQKYKIKNLF